MALLLIAGMLPVPMECRADTEFEIKHLMAYIEKTNCTFIRNGKEYNGEEALVHIQNKYAYSKRWVKSAEDFITYAVTKSSMTGQPYKVRCDGQVKFSAEWLTKELNRFRGKPE
jgi:hypothetical protein